MTDMLWITIITAVLAFFGTVANGIVAVLVAKLNTKTTDTAVEVSRVKYKAEEATTIVKQVKAKLEETNSTLDGKITDIHVLVNSNMGIQLKISAAALRRVASITKNEYDVLAADEAEALLQAHQTGQAIVDENEGKNAVSSNSNVD